jgi:hypothetical protein
MKNFLDLQQVYNQRALIEPELIPTESSSFFLFISAWFGFVVLLILFQHSKRLLPSKLSKHSPEWCSTEPIEFHCKDITSFIKYLCERKYPHHPIAILSSKPLQIASLEMGLHHKHFFVHESLMIENGCKNTLKKHPLLFSQKILICILMSTSISFA